MNNNLEFEDESPEPDSIEDNYPRTNYEAGFGEKMYSVVEVNNLLEEYTNRIVENAKIEWSGSMVTGNVDKESITSQLPKFLKELE